MKKSLAMLLAVLLCVSLVACTVQPDAPTTAPTEEPTLVLPTDPTVELVDPSIGGNVTPPDEMPDKPEAEFSLPPGERPGERGEVSDK